MAQRKAARKSSARHNSKRTSTPSTTQLHGKSRWDMPEPLLAIIDEHKYMLRLLPLLEAEASKIKRNKPADYECLASLMDYISNFPDLYHHPKEDLIFARMSGVAPEISDAIERLRNDHEKMAEQTLRIQQQLVEQQNSPSRLEARELADELNQYARRLREHMVLEEEVVLQPALETLKKRDWQEIEQALKAVNDPIFGDEVSTRYLPLMWRYINEIVTVSSSGSVPIGAIESVLSRYEQGLYVLSEARSLPKLFVQNRFQAHKGRLKRLTELKSVRSLSDIKAWGQTEKEAFSEDWRQLFDELKHTMGASSRPLANDKIYREPNAITLNSESEILSYQSRPYEADANSQISWQAALFNVLGRFTIKRMMSNLDLEDNRVLRRMRRVAKSVPPGTRIEALEGADFKAVQITPEHGIEGERTIFHLPGGGFFAPATDMHRTMLGRLACQTGSRAWLVSYRLLPEYTFPAGLEDALAAYKHLLDSGTPPEQIVVTGDSAGGNIALAMLLAARDQGLPMPGACALISPCTDMTYTVGSRESNRWKDPLLPKGDKKDLRKSYSGEHSLDHPLISPVLGDFTGFPPMLAFASSTESLLDDTLIVARKARAKGVDVEVEIWESMPHAWLLFSFLPEAQAATARLGEFIEERLA